MITATIIQDSIANGVRITTFELEYPRFIHSELMTHRVFSRNAASSRAIPIDTMIANVEENPAMPVHWGKNQPGMQAKEELSEFEAEIAKRLWGIGMEEAIIRVKALNHVGVHKQIANRLIEPFTHMKTIVTSTEWSNWYELRMHEDAQPEIYKLAVAMYKAQLESTPMLIHNGEWHVPYIHREHLEGKMTYSTNDYLLTVEESKIVSASCCAQVSYRKNDDSLDKAKKIFDRLINSKPQHASPIEHQATPMLFANADWYTRPWKPGVTHYDRNGNFWSNNFRGWLQHRALIGENNETI